MKFLAIVVVALLAAANAEKPLRLLSVEETTAYDYHNRVGIPLFKAIQEDEEQMLADPSRIVGGSGASLGVYPYQAGLMITLNSGGTSVCGGSLISNNRVATAAHCCTSARQITVVLGSLTISSGGTRITTTNIQIHGSYNSNTIANDVAILGISSVGFTNNIRSIAMATGTATHAGTNGWASGWGRTTNNGGVSATKQHVQLPIITNAVCQQTFGNLIIASTICTSGAGGRGTCNGDSGGPLANNARNLLLGIVSFGAAAGCSNGFPAAYARVTSFEPWLRARM